MRIAIVGMACCYPDANSPAELWENVLARRRAFRRIPPERLNLDDYFSPDPNTPDAIYAQEAAVIAGYRFDRVKFRIAGPTFRSADLTHWLALDMAAQALIDAGLADGEGLPRETTGVLVGNTLTGEFSRAQVLRLRWPYVRRVVEERLAAQGWDLAKRRTFLDALEELYKAPFEPVGEETLAGGLSNTIAGRICNHFHLRGGGYTLDGACSSSLLAVAQACSALASGELDAALVGGVDLSLDPFELIGFAKTHALARDGMLVYDRNSTGFLPGEGCGFVVLMRYEDALARGLRCYALICGWGVSSDGGGGITRPELAGQRLALERAYRRAGYSIDTVALLEGHGTGTPVGDEVELRTLSEMLHSAPAPVAIGSVKANIGHTKAAAGIAGLIKATLAAYHQILPPATGVVIPHPLLAGGPLRILEEGECWPQDRPLRAGVSSFGFGGINAHLTLEGCASVRRRSLAEHEQRLLASFQDTELFLLGAGDLPSLIAQVERLSESAKQLSYAELADLAACLAQRLDGTLIRAALVAATPKELAERLAILRSWLKEGETERLDSEGGIFLGAGKKPPRIAFLFPGQASPVRFSGGALARRFATVRAWYAGVRLPTTENTLATSASQPAIVIAELAGLRLLNALGVTAELAIGHSLGELTALHWAGAMDEETLLALVQARAQAMAEAPGTGAMASLAADAAATAALLEGEEQVVIAGLNAPAQTVISGEAQAVARVCAKAKALGIATTPLPVSHAFHSPLMRPAAKRLTEYLGSKRLAPISRRVLSTVTGGWLDPADDLKALLVRQLTAPVRFRQTLAHAAEEADLLLEVGPGQVLTNLARTNCQRPVISLDCAGPSLRSLFLGLGAAYALGAPIEVQRLFSDRFVRAFDPERKLTFFLNPCELAPRCKAKPSSLGQVDKPSRMDSETVHSGAAETNSLELVRQLVAQRAELPVEAVQDHHHLLRDLHLNSISIGQLMAEAARQLGLPPPLAPTEYAGATVAQAAQALESLRQSGFASAPGAESIPAGVDAWVRTFAVERIAKPLAAKPQKLKGEGDWQVFAPQDHPLAKPLAETLKALGGAGILACLPPTQDENAFAILLAAARAALEQDGYPRYFVLVQHDGIAASFARTLHLEAKELTTCVVDVPPIEAACSWVLAEVQAAESYLEAYYDAHGRRFENALRLLSIPEDSREMPLGATDVLLISGGGKGIAAECGLALAKENGVKLVLLGRSSPAQDRALAENLARFAAAGIAFRYFSVDVTDAEAVRRAVTKAEAELGPVTAILHGAGVNDPRPLRLLDLAALSHTLAPKLQGLRNLLAAVYPERLRLLVTFSSVIGRIGLHGEADYALANAALSRLTEDFQAKHPKCRCLALEWSIWSGVGMGERLGRVDALLRQGISPISVDEGILWLRRLLGSSTPVRVVVSGRLGPNPPLPLLPQAELPFLRFLEHPRLFYPGIELVVEAELSGASDPYLDDHAFQGERLLPAVLGLEAMAQAARALTHKTEAPAFENVQFSHPIVVGEAGISLRIAALARSPDEVEVVLRSSQSGFQLDHFRAVCRFSPSHQEEGGQPPRAPANGENRVYLPLDPKQDLYGALLFQRGRFQRLLAYRELGAFRCCADIAPDETGVWFARYLPQELLLGDPGSRDAALHAIQACIPHATVLPIGLDRWLPGDLETPGPWTVQAQEHWQEGEVYCYTVAIYGADGSLRECFEGLRLRRVAEVSRTAWPRSLLVPYLERRVQELTGAAIAVALEQSGASDRAMQTALGSNKTIRRRPDGKPEAEGENTVSAAHSGNLTLAVAGKSPVACDLEKIIARHEQTWRDLLGVERYALAELIAQATGEDLHAAATRVWTALECLKKAGAAATASLVLLAVEKDRWVLLGSGHHTIATCCVTLEPSQKLGIAILAEKNPCRASKPTSKLEQRCAPTNTATS